MVIGSDIFDDTSVSSSLQRYVDWICKAGRRLLSACLYLSLDSNKTIIMHIQARPYSDISCLSSCVLSLTFVALHISGNARVHVCTLHPRIMRNPKSSQYR